jgi:hypothetical protein
MSLDENDPESPSVGGIEIADFSVAFERSTRSNSIPGRPNQDTIKGEAR